jgi:hypothetical protein
MLLVESIDKLSWPNRLIEHRINKKIVILFIIQKYKTIKYVILSWTGDLKNIDINYEIAGQARNDDYNNEIIPSDFQTLNTFIHYFLMHKF